MPCLQSGESLINEQKVANIAKKVYPSVNYAAMKARQRHLWINLGRVNPSYDVLSKKPGHRCLIHRQVIELDRSVTFKSFVFKIVE
jgi:hypothetical protein